ncbi:MULTISPECIES: PH domain-containing protein [Sporosarcina]
MSEQRYKLHWITAVIETLKAVKEAIFPLIVLIFANGWRKGGTGLWYVDYLSYIIFGVLIIFLLVSGIIKWIRFEYWFEDDELRIESGLFVKKKRYIPFDRIQSLDYTEGIFHRPFQLVKVKVETAGSSSLKKAEGELTAITKEAANRIEYEMQAAKKRKKEAVNGVNELETKEIMDAMPVEEVIDEVIPSKKIFSMTNKDLLLLATTSGGIGVILSGVAIFLSQFGDILPYEWMFEEISAFIKFGILIVGIVVFLALLFVWLLSVGMTYLSHYGFTVSLEKEDIVITRGLLEKKRVTVPLKRVQSVSVNENPLRQLFGYANVVLHSAGGGVGDSSKINLFPLVKKNRLKEPLQEIFPELNLEEPNYKLTSRGRHFYYRIDFVWMLPVIGALSYFFFPYGLFSLAIIPIIIGMGLWQHRSAAIGLDGQQLTMRYRGIGLHTAYMMKKRIQSMEMRQSYFHKRKGVATIVTNVKSGIGVHHATVQHMEVEEAERLYDWYGGNKKAVDRQADKNVGERLED